MAAHPFHPSRHPRAQRAKALSCPPRLERGVTLLELMIALVVISALTLIWAGTTDDAFTAGSAAQDANQDALNKRLASVLLDYAATVGTTGDLPAPYTNGTTKKVIYDGTNTALQALLVQARIRPVEANGDGTAADNVRVYQTATGLTVNVPLYNTFGPILTLTYAEGIIVATHCARTATCNTVGTGGVPGNSGAFTSANLATYALTGDDFGLARFSTLAIQKQKLTQSADNIDTIRVRMQEYFRERQRNATANDTTNFYPRDAGAVSLGTTADCHSDGWYRLDNTTVLAQVGLVNTVNGKNAWGGQLHYCPDYDPTGAAGADAPPHYAAVRILSSPSTGGNPTNATVNTVIPF